MPDDLRLPFRQGPMIVSSGPESMYRAFTTCERSNGSGSLKAKPTSARRRSVHNSNRSGGHISTL